MCYPRERIQYIWLKRVSEPRLVVCVCMCVRVCMCMYACICVCACVCVMCRGLGMVVRKGHVWSRTWRTWVYEPFQYLGEERSGRGSEAQGCWGTARSEETEGKTSAPLVPLLPRVLGAEAGPTLPRPSQHPLPRAGLAPLCAPGEPSPYNYHPLPRAISCRLVNRTSFSSTHIMVCLKRCQRSQFSWTGTIDERWSLQRVPAGAGPTESKTRTQGWRNHLAKPA